jgi:redox-sensitive bicupin YhaK (pirin superfamily)
MPVLVIGPAEVAEVVMITIRRADERGHANFGWLDTYHTFSFNTYYDPKHMGFRSLRVINEDTVSPGQGFGTHGHRDMEILSYVLEGALEHKDSMGSGSVLKADDVQRMTAGTGVTHSEFNHSRTEPVHFIQIWILPEKQGLEPGYEEKTIPNEEKRGKLRVVASPDGRQGSIKIHQDALIYASVLNKGDSIEHRLAPGRHAWVQVARGDLHVNGKRLRHGDGAAVSEEPTLRLDGDGEAEILLFDVS